MFRRIVVAHVVFWAAAFLSVSAVAQDETAASGQDSTAEKAPARTETKAPHASLARIAICEDVQERTPIGEADRFPSDVGRLWCFTKVVDADPPTRIFHRWYVGDSLMEEIPIRIDGKSWRCWTNKGIRMSWRGPCRVEIVTESGDVLGTKEFSLSAPTASAESSESSES